MQRLSRCLVAIMALALALALCYLAPVSFVSPSPRVAPMEAPRVRRVTESLGNSMPSSFSCGVLLMTAAVAGAGKKTSRRASIMGQFGTLKQEDEENEEQRAAGQVSNPDAGFKREQEKIDALMDQEVDEAELEEYAKKFAAEEQADTKARQVRFELYPSKQYVLYLAKKNAVRTWTSDGPDGKNRGCIEVQIAVATEKIRNMILHMREFRRDYRTRLKLVSLVCRRRRMLDKLAATNLDSYMKIRDELKIRHIYRIEALKNRLASYMYPIRDRRPAPGRKTKNRLKKAKQLMSRRLANQLRQGREHKIIHRTQKKLNFRRWLARPYDEVAAWEKGNEVGTYVDPLNLP